MDTRRLVTILATLLLTTPVLCAERVEIVVQPGEYTIEQALQAARLRRLQGEDIHPVLRLQAGTYRLTQPIILRP